MLTNDELQQLLNLARTSPSAAWLQFARYSHERAHYGVVAIRSVQDKLQAFIDVAAHDDDIPF